VEAASSEAGGQRRQALILAAIWAVAALATRVRRRPAWGAALGATLGLLLPDVFVLFAGVGSPWNIVGHSILVPGFLYLSEAETPAEKGFFGLMSGGVALHILEDLATGFAPPMGVPVGAALPWLWANAVLGIGLVLASRRVR
jgi:hypothetical protein